MSGVSSNKPYNIAKRVIWEAYQQVRTNRGAAAIDDETIADFERNLPKNLYKLWNRMSSGSYLVGDGPVQFGLWRGFNRSMHTITDWLICGFC